LTRAKAMALMRATMGIRQSRWEFAKERDLYSDLLELSHCDEIERFVERALAVVLSHSGATAGYLEFYDADAEPKPGWLAAHGLSAAVVRSVRDCVAAGTGGGPEPWWLEAEHHGVVCVSLGTPPIGVLCLYVDRDGPSSGETVRTAVLAARKLLKLSHALMDRMCMRARLGVTAPSRTALASGGMVGTSAALVEVLRRAAKIAPIDEPVLITGARGTGKTTLARILHDSSARAAKPFESINCAGFVDQLIESELFGVRKGAFTDATQDSPGLLAAVDGGTLFLDEISELSLRAQAKLLHVMEGNAFRPLGASRSISADVRLLAATNADLTELVRQGLFRADFYDRLTGLSIRIPSLAERQEDIRPLCKHFCRETWMRHGWYELTLSPWTLRAARQAEWPGNVRQLARKIRVAVIDAHAEGVCIVAPHHLFPELDEREPMRLSFNDARRDFDRTYVLDALERNGWNKRQTAHELRVARSTLYKLEATHGLRGPCRPSLDADATPSGIRLRGRRTGPSSASNE
jgi:DNA-binding NtrC family response regulator